MTIEVRRLEPGDDHSTFRSGNIELDRFFQRFAGQNQFKHHLGTTYVAVSQGAIVGFVTVAAAEVVVADLPASRRRRLPAYPLPALRVARLATDERARGRGVGSRLLEAVFRLALEAAERFGCVGVLVDAKEEAVPFYERYGFERLELDRGVLRERPAPVAMFLELGAIARPDER